MSNSTACQLLVSANTLDECILLQDLSVPWIDLKEPRHGPLGRPELPLVKQFANRMTSASSIKAHWSIAGGELPDWKPQADLGYIEAVCLRETARGTNRGPNRTDGHIKWGLAQAERTSDWQVKLAKLVEQIPSPGQVILVHYADYARVPSPDRSPWINSPNLADSNRIGSEFAVLFAETQRIEPAPSIQDLSN